MKKLFFLLFGFWFLVFNDSLHAGVEVQNAANARKNSQKGYDFYDSSGAKTGYSIPNKRGGYDFYDVHGNVTSSLRQEEKGKNTYAFQDASGIKKGSLKKAPSGEYIYKDKQSGRQASSAPYVRGDVGSLSPDVFQGKKRVK